ncbi:MAG: SRPBCC family protein [Kofleriaceae bacterium]
MTTTLPPIRKQLTVDAPVDKAFRVFTANMGAWWPREHHIGTSPLAQCVIEPKIDGRWYEVGEDGSTCEWGKVLAWDPPHRVVLAWQLNFEFKYDAALITEVEVRFTPLNATQTQIDFEHRGLERLGPQAARTAGEMDAGWGGILDRFASAAAT